MAKLAVPNGTHPSSTPASATIHATTACSSLRHGFFPFLAPFHYSHGMKGWEWTMAAPLGLLGDREVSWQMQDQLYAMPHIDLLLVGGRDREDGSALMG